MAILREQVGDKGIILVECDVYGRDADERTKDQKEDLLFRKCATDEDEIEWKRQYDKETLLSLQLKKEIVELNVTKTETSEQSKKLKDEIGGAVNIPELDADVEEFVKNTFFADKSVTIPEHKSIVLNSEQRIDCANYIMGTEFQNKKDARVEELVSAYNNMEGQIKTKETALAVIENEIRVNIVGAHQTFMSQMLGEVSGKERTTYAGRNKKKKRLVEVKTEPDNKKKAALARSDTLNVGALGGKPDDDVVEKLDLAIQKRKPNMDTAKDRFLYYGRKLEEGSDTPWLIDGVNFDKINQDAFASVVMRKWFGNMSEDHAEVLKQICLKGLKTGEKFDRVSVARILCDDLAFWDEDDKTLAF